MAVDGSLPLSPLIPLIWGEGVDGSAYLDLLGLVWDHRLGLPKIPIGFFPVGSRLLLFGGLLP